MKINEGIIKTFDVPHRNTMLGNIPLSLSLGDKSGHSDIGKFQAFA